MSVGGQEEELQFTERRERVLSSPRPAQISNTKKRLAHHDDDDGDGVLGGGGGERATSSEDGSRSRSSLQRAEVTVEMKGIRETTLSCSDTVVSSRVRTVYERTSSSGKGGSSSSAESGHGDAEEGDDSPFAPGDEGHAEEFVVGNKRTRNLSSDSYYISQTYQISSPSSPRTVSALSTVGSPRFRSSRELSVGSAESGDLEDIAKNHFVDRREEEIPNASACLEKISPREKRVQFKDVEDVKEADKKPDDELTERIKSSREGVQQMIESSYMVSDITDVIDDHMGPNSPLKLKEKPIATDVNQENINLDLPTSGASPDRSLSPVLAFSPGAAIRSYAMEELAERRSRNNTPDRTTEQPGDPVTAPTQPNTFTFSPPLGSEDEGTSVDAFVSETSVKNSSRPGVSIATEPSSEKASLFPSYAIASPIATTEEEEAEALDKLVDLESIQAGYRFHDVGMMLSAEEELGGICNPAFDDTDSNEIPFAQSSENRAPAQLSAGEATLTFSNFSPVSQAQNEQSRVIAYDQTATSAAIPNSAVEDATRYKDLPTARQLIQQQESPLLSHAQACTTSAAPSPLITPGVSSSTTRKPRVDYPPVTVSRRFNVRDKKFESSLKSKGAVLQSESVSYAVYYDTPDWQLTLSDCWLRSQNGRWQVSAGFTKLFDTCTQDQFLDTEDGDHIIRLISNVLKPTTERTAESQPALPGTPSGSVSRFVHQSGLREFARYATWRRVYSLVNGEKKKISVELTIPEYGFWVGEATATVEGVRDGLSLATSSIDTLWRDTGVSPLCLIEA